jgi:uncharacterized protein YndB with AHSA1/START domain
VTTDGPPAVLPDAVIERVYDAPRRLVFKCWAEPERAARWWGPKGFTTIECRMDIRPGGTWRLGMRGDDGTEHWRRGVYREVVEPERLVFTFGREEPDGSLGPETLVTVTLAEAGTGTRLTLRQTAFPSAASREATLRGWTSSLERFEEYLMSVTPGAPGD